MGKYDKDIEMIYFEIDIGDYDIILPNTDNY